MAWRADGCKYDTGDTLFGKMTKPLLVETIWNIPVDAMTFSNGRWDASHVRDPGQGGALRRSWRLLAGVASDSFSVSDP